MNQTNHTSQTNQASQTGAWIESLRPKTLPLALASIVTGVALASWQGHFQWGVALFALITAGLLQILSNLANDYGDAIKGSDTETRIGPNRGMQKGLITQAQMKKALAITVILTIISGITLIALACQKPSDIIGFVILGLLAIIAAITYTVGNRPYGYIGLGDISVLIFFGWLSVAGTYYLLSTQFDAVVMLPATACGLLSAAVLNINNLRDIDNDKSNGKNTLAVRLGPIWGRRYHALLLTGAVLCLAIFTLFYVKSWQGWLFVLAIPLLYRHAMYVLHHPNAIEMRPMLENMVKSALLTNILFSLGILLS